MSNERVKIKDEVTLALYNSKGRVKKTSGTDKRRTKLEKLIRFLRLVVENW